MISRVHVTLNNMCLNTPRVMLTHLDGSLILSVHNTADHLLNLVPLSPQPEGEGALDEHVQHDAQAPHVRSVALVLGRRQDLWQAGKSLMTGTTSTPLMGR